MDPFLEITEFATEFGRDLSAAEQPQAVRLLQVVSDWIRAKAPDDVLDTAAAQVTFEVVRDAINYGEFEPLTSFSNTTSRRTEAGTLRLRGEQAINDYLTPRQKRLLGIPVSGGAVGYFPKCDY
jgi:hypothetical protein